MIPYQIFTKTLQRHDRLSQEASAFLCLYLSYGRESVARKASAFLGAHMLSNRASAMNAISCPGPGNLCTI